MGVVAAIAFAAALVLAVRWFGLTVREPVRQRTAMALTATFVGLLLLGWWFLTSGDTTESRILSPLILPSPMEVLDAFPRLHAEQALVQSAFTSWWRVTEGFLIAVLLAVPLGVYMGTFPPIMAFFKPLELIGSYVPIVCFMPLTLAWWGLSETQKIGFLTIACFVALLPLVVKSVAAVPSAILDVSVTKGASNWQLVKDVIFPVALPDIWENMRGVYGIGWGWIVLAELVNSEKGLGHLIYISERRGHTFAIFAVIVVIVVIAVTCDKLWAWSGKRLFPGRAYE